MENQAQIETETEQVAEVELSEREKWFNGVTEMMEWLKVNPQAEIPQFTRFVNYCYGKATTAEAVRALGECEKEYTDWTIAFIKKFGPIKYGFYTSRETICEKKVVGKKIVPMQPSYYSPEVPEHEEDIVEWECGSLLAPAQNVENPT